MRAAMRWSCPAVLLATGAARLAARAALRAGAGLVTIASPREALAVNAAATLAVMVRPVDGPRSSADLLADRRLQRDRARAGRRVGGAHAGPGEAALDGERAVVLDADALTSFADDPAALVRRRQSDAETRRRC